MKKQVVVLGSKSDITSTNAIINTYTNGNIIGDQAGGICAELVDPEREVEVVGMGFQLF